MKHRFCVIRKVPFRVSKTGRIVWANVVAENIVGTALLLVPTSQVDEEHSIVFATESVAERVFEASDAHPVLQLGSFEVLELGKILKFLGTRLMADEITRLLEKGVDD